MGAVLKSASGQIFFALVTRTSASRDQGSSGTAVFRSMSVPLKGSERPTIAVRKSFRGSANEMIWASSASFFLTQAAMYQAAVPLPCRARPATPMVRCMDQFPVMLSRSLSRPSALVAAAGGGGGAESGAGCGAEDRDIG